MNVIRQNLEVRPATRSAPVWQPSEDSPWRFDANATFNEKVFSEAWKDHRGEAYHRYRRDWHEVPASKTELDFPLHLDIETTTRCNLLCPMCPRTLLVEKGTFNDFGFITRAEYASIIDQGWKVWSRKPIESSPPQKSAAISALRGRYHRQSNR